MKTYQQMAYEVLKARDAVLLKKEQQKRQIIMILPMAMSACFAMGIGLHVWQNQQNAPKIQSVLEEVTETAEETSSPAVCLTTEFSVETETIPTETEIKSETEAIPTETEIKSETEPVTEEMQILTESVTEADTIPIISETILVTEAVPEETEPEQIVISEEIPAPVQPEPEFIETEPVTETFYETLPTEIPIQEEEVIPEEPTFSAVIALSRITLHIAGTQENEEIPFHAVGIILNSEQVGTWFDTVDMTIQYPDGTSDTIEHIGDAYLVKDVSEEILAAVRFSGEEQYRLFCSDATDEETFQKLLEEIHIQ